MRTYFFNEGPGVAIVGGCLIPPGEGRDVDLPDQAQAAPADQADTADQAGASGAGGGEGGKGGEGGGGDTATPNPQLVALLEHSVRDIVPELAALDDLQLAAAAVIEQAGQARKGVLGAITEQQLQRAQLRAGGAPT
jgi:hypothetical protein